MKLEELAEIKGLFRQVATVPAGNLQEKIEAVIAKEVYKRYEWALKIANNSLKDWRLAVRAALSTEMPLHFAKRRRPADRPYPFKNSGTLREGVKTKVWGKTFPRQYQITMRAEISATRINNNGSMAEYALKLNEGKPRRKDGKIPRWRGFLDRALFRGDFSRGIKSAKEVFDEIKKRLRG